MMVDYVPNLTLHAWVPEIMQGRVFTFHWMVLNGVVQGVLIVFVFVFAHGDIMLAIHIFLNAHRHDDAAEILTLRSRYQMRATFIAVMQNGDGKGISRFGAGAGIHQRL